MIPLCPTWTPAPGISELLIGFQVACGCRIGLKPSRSSALSFSKNRLTRASLGESAIGDPSSLLLRRRLLREAATAFVADDPAARWIAEVRADDEHVGVREIVDELH